MSISNPVRHSISTPRSPALAFICATRSRAGADFFPADTDLEDDCATVKCPGTMAPQNSAVAAIRDISRAENGAEVLRIAGARIMCQTVSYDKRRERI